MITVEDVRRITASLPRAYEVVVRDHIKFRVGRIVFVAFSRDETVMGVGFPKEERARKLLQANEMSSSCGGARCGS